MCLGIVDAGLAADKGTYNCVPQELRWNQIKARNQFLFPTPGHYNGNGTALVCGHQGVNGCATGTVIVMAGNHVWTDSNKEKEVRGGMDAYVCNTSGFNAWQNNALGFLKECDSGQKKSWDKIGEIQGQNILCADKKDVFNRNGYCKKACFTKDCPNCDEQPPAEQGCGDSGGVVVPVGGRSATKTCTPSLGDAGASECTCTCLKGGKWQCDVDNCVKPKQLDRNQRNISGGLGVCKDGNNPGPVQSCKESRSSDEGKACCDLSSKVAKWDGKNCLCKDSDEEFKIQNGKGVCVAKQQKSCKDLHEGNTEAIACCEAGEHWIDGKCECADENKNWEYDAKAKTGKCIDNGSVVNPGSTTTCTEANCKITINQTIRCFNNGNYFNSTENYSVCKEDLDAQRLDCDGLKARVNACTDTDCIRKLLTRIEKYDELIARVCGGSGVVTTPVPDNGAEILAAENTLTSFFRNAESDASVWKDKDGNFNTARLASDLTAGVILGTVGGVVSGVVIKKKQVEKGFDALHCTVGGQTVANWGDIFNVGLRR